MESLSLAHMAPCILVAKDVAGSRSYAFESYFKIKIFFLPKEKCGLTLLEDPWGMCHVGVADGLSSLHLLFA